MNHHHCGDCCRRLRGLVVPPLVFGHRSSGPADGRHFSFSNSLIRSGIWATVKVPLTQYLPPSGSDLISGGGRTLIRFSYLLRVREYATRHAGEHGETVIRLDNCVSHAVLSHSVVSLLSHSFLLVRIVVLLISISLPARGLLSPGCPDHVSAWSSMVGSRQYAVQG